MRRCCATCRHYIPASGEDYKGVCFEGGYSEISNPHRSLTGEDCNAWRKNFTADQVSEMLMRLARVDSGLPQDDRDMLFIAHCFINANYPLVDAALNKERG